jgi:hypothetical protein
VQMIVEAAGDPAPDFPRGDIEKHRREISEPEQFIINFNYLVRRLGRLKRRER